VYRFAKQRSEPTSDKRGAKTDELQLTPLELIVRIAALVPPPRTHRHRYFGVLAPNSPFRAAAVAIAAPVQQATAEPAQTGTGEGDGRPGLVPLGNALPSAPEPGASPKRSPTHYRGPF
jgi:hypothetical protein